MRRLCDGGAVENVVSRFMYTVCKGIGGRNYVAL